VHLVGFIRKKFVTMHGLMNVKYSLLIGGIYFETFYLICFRYLRRKQYDCVFEDFIFYFEFMISHCKSSSTRGEMLRVEQIARINLN
jgi:hypothetical protein